MSPTKMDRRMAATATEVSSAYGLPPEEMTTTMFCGSCEAEISISGTSAHDRVSQLSGLCAAEIQKEAAA